MLNNYIAQAGVNLGINNSVSSFGNASQITPASLVRFAVMGLLVVSSLVFFLMLLWGGLQWILSGGDKAKTESARGSITAALIGLVIVFAAWAILQLMSSLVGINVNNLTLPTLYP